VTDFIFLSVAFGPRYVEQQTRLHKSICDHYSSDHHIMWTDTLPPGSKTHEESPYGFKVHAVEYARSLGHKKIIWIDTACVLQDKVDYWFDLIPEYGVVAVRDDNKLSNHIGSAALMKWSLVSISDAYHLVGGSLYVFDFNNHPSAKIFEQWKWMEQQGGFADESKHRHDESMMAMCLYMNGSEPVPYDKCRYNNGPGSIVTKHHFK
jgi:hypothetical protein